MEHIRTDSAYYQSIDEFLQLIDKHVSNNGRLNLELFENTTDAKLLKEDQHSELPLFGIVHGIGSGIIITEILRRILETKYPTLTVVKPHLPDINRMTVVKLSPGSLLDTTEAGMPNGWITMGRINDRMIWRFFQRILSYMTELPFLSNKKQ